jgi:hypothetical protein
MGFIANFKAKRSAKRAKAAYELELYEWNRENEVLNQALEIFQDASAQKITACQCQPLNLS